MNVRVGYAFSAVLMVGLLMSACGSDEGSSDTGADDVVVESVTPAETAAPDAETPTATAAPDAETPVATEAASGDAPTEGLCASIPDLDAIEGAIGEAVKDPLDNGEPGYAQGCTLLRAADDFPGITFNFTPDRSIDDQIEFVSSNFDIDIVPLPGADGFYIGEGNSVYYVLDGDLYQTSASLSGDGDPQAAAVNMMNAWLGL